MKKIFSNRIISVSSSVLASVMAVALVGYAATTISTNINTAGTLTVSGASTLSGNITADGTSATTTISGGLRADTGDNTLVVDFSSSRVGVGTTSPSVLMSVQGSSIFGSADADIASFRAGDIQFNSNATTTITTKNFTGININAGDFVLEPSFNLAGFATTSPQATLSVGGSTILGSADASIVSFRAGDIRLNSNATTTIATKNQMGINIGSGDLVLDSDANRLHVGSSTPIRGTLGVYGTGTTTIAIGTSTAGRGTCIEMKAASNGATMRIFATSTDIGFLRVEPGGCQDGGNNGGL